ncbi:uncharacterized protein [Rutidosis leptorrhynchoides]|uniref:uncharacterized protein n=1 Tax=Rutidosis leptorrhynchoides TaxID=125765 RepID=UPI003A98D685
MEAYGNVFDEEWMNLGSMFSSDHDSFHFTELFTNEHDHASNLDTSIVWPSTNESNSSSSSIIDDHIVSYSSDHELKTNMYNYLSQESSDAHDIFQLCPSNNVRADDVSDQSEDQCMIEEGDTSNFLLLGQLLSGEQMDELSIKHEAVAEKGKRENSVCQPMLTADLKRKYESIEVSNEMEININPKKKTRVSRDTKNKKNLPVKKNQKTIYNNSIDQYEGENSQQNNQKITSKNNRRGNHVQSSSSCSSEYDSNACQDLDGGAINVNEKTRAGRGAATDPQSIYARKRRERINERLRILQTLVPNGTKVDISTMLEEAVHYVKFLQLQIKLLSSDDKWMYAPIAYNGMDMGLRDVTLPTP